MERNIGAIERALSMAAGAALVAYAMSGSRRTNALNVTAAAGAGLVGRGLSGYCPVSAAFGRNKSDTRVALAGRRGIRVRERVRINRSPHDVFAFWRTLSNLPQFMDHLVEVRVIDSTRSRWTAKAPAGTTVSWDAEIINEIDGELIGVALNRECRRGHSRFGAVCSRTRRLRTFSSPCNTTRLRVHSAHGWHGSSDGNHRSKFEPTWRS